MNKRLGKNDYIFLLCIIIGACIFLGLFYGLNNKRADIVTVTVDGIEFGQYSLDENREIQITNSAGEVTNTLVINNGKANMTEANCPDLLCVKQKAISLDKETIVCLPNKVVVEVKASSQADVDAIAN